MAQLKDLIVTGDVRSLGKVYAPEFVGKLTGTADRAIADNNGANIANTYIKDLSVDENTNSIITFTRGNNSTDTLNIKGIGHAVKDSSGATMTQRGNLKFIGLDVADSSTNDETVVTYEDTNFIGTIDQWELLSDAEKAHYKTVDTPEDVTIDTPAHLTMPIATLEWLNVIVQYTGATNANYTSGYFYKCVSYLNAQNNTAYKWVNIMVQPPIAESMIAPIEENASSSARAYSIGDQLILDGVLYDVIANISIGDALVNDTNIDEAEPISEKINNKQDALTFDNTPTSGSTNSITSGAVFSYIDTMITQAVEASY